MNSVDWFVHGFETDRHARELSDAIMTTGNKVHLMRLPPFSAELPDPPTEPFVLYGGTRIIEAAAITPGWDRGVWYDARTFRWQTNALKWGTKNMLMQDAYISLSFEDLSLLEYKKSDKIFVRPDSDLKEFAGEVMTFQELLDWADRITSISDEPGMTVTSKTDIIVGDEMEIAREWRIFVVDSVPIECSRYRSYGLFDPVREFSDEVREFATTICEKYLPAPVIVIDIGAEPNGRLGVIEANCFNSSGWYDVDINTVVAAVSEYVSN